MQEDILLQISNKLRELRKAQGITLQDVADNAGVTKSLVSQVENSRAVPSLLVLLNLIKAVGADLNSFFAAIDTTASTEKVIVKRRKEYTFFEKENATGFMYERVLSTTIGTQHVDVVLLTLQPGAQREMITTDALEMKYVINGEVEYLIADKTYHLSAGDSIYFDGREPHVPHNHASEAAVMLVFYFFGAAFG